MENKNNQNSETNPIESDLKDKNKQNLDSDLDKKKEENIEEIKKSPEEIIFDLEDKLVKNLC